MSTSPETPLVLLGPGGEYQRAWSETDINAIVTAAGWRPTLIGLAVVFAVGIAAAILFDSQNASPATGVRHGGAERQYSAPHLFETEG